METRNCPNCSAPYEITSIRCPYCGTAYYDMSAINMDTREPFYLKIRVNGLTITQLVRPLVASFEIRYDEIIPTSRRGERDCHFRTGAELISNIEFHAITDSNGVYATAIKEDENVRS